MTSLHKLPNTRPEPPVDAERRTSSLFEGLDARTVALLIIALGVTVFLLQHMQTLLAPLAFGLLLFYALDPRGDATGADPRAAVDWRSSCARA